MGSRKSSSLITAANSFQRIQLTTICSKTSLKVNRSNMSPFPRGNLKKTERLNVMLKRLRTRFFVFSLSQTLRKLNTLPITGGNFFNYFRPHIGLKGRWPNELYLRNPPPRVCYYLSRIWNEELRFSTIFM